MSKGSAKVASKPAPTKASAKPAPADKNAFGNIRIDFFYDQYYLIAFMTLCLLMIAIGMGLWAVFEHKLQNVPNQGIPSPIALKNANGNIVVNVGDPVLKFPSTVDNKLIFPTPLSEPFLSTPTLLEWAVEAVVKSYTFNFVNYNQIILNSSVFYTDAGYQNYRRTLIESNIANSVDRKKYVLSVTPTAAPNILKEKPTPDGFYSWQIQFPIMMTYQNVRETQRSEWIVTMAIQRVPLSTSPYGVAIAALIVREGRLSI